MTTSAALQDAIHELVRAMNSIHVQRTAQYDAQEVKDWGATRADAEELERIQLARLRVATLGVRVVDDALRDKVAEVVSESTIARTAGPEDSVDRLQALYTVAGHVQNELGVLTRELY